MTSLRSLWLGIAIALTGCGSDGNVEWQGIYQIAKSSFGKGPTISLEQASAIPYATLGIRVGDDPQVVAILATDEGAEKLWAVGRKITLVTVGGRIQRTVGLEHNLSWSTISRREDLASFAGGATMPGKISWTADFQDMRRFSVQIACDERPAGNEIISILGQSISVLRINESCNSSDGSWKFDNVFWIGRSDGLIWRSVQHVHPELDPIEIELFRPPASSP